MNFDALETTSSLEQVALERKVSKIIARQSEIERDVSLNRELHIHYLQQGLKSLPQAFSSLEASRPWILYWITHSLALLEAGLPPEVSQQDIADFLTASQHPSGGIGGSPGQLPHLATTYAGVAAAMTAGRVALASIDRTGVGRFLEQSCVLPSQGGGFRVCKGGEVDVRGCYTAMATAHMLRLDKHRLAGRAGMLQYVKRCQTYEGGMGGESGNEAHGGYTYCGLASLMLVGQAHHLDLPALLGFAVRCQGTVEGGFMGRTNKLVDGCYSFWQGGLFPLLQRLTPELLRQTGNPYPLPPSNLGAMVVPSPPSGQPVSPNRQAENAARIAQGCLSDAELARSELRSRPKAPGSPVGDREEAAEKLALNRVAAARKQLDAAMEVGSILQTCTTTGRTQAEGSCGEAAEEVAPAPDSTGMQLFDVEALQRWVLLCCQGPNGGLRDKPGKPPDYYHTCYCLSGLSAAQHLGGAGEQSHIGRDDRLAKADPLCNVVESKLQAALSSLQPL